MGYLEVNSMAAIAPVPAGLACQKCRSRMFFAQMTESALAPRTDCSFQGPLRAPLRYLPSKHWDK
jgi:hypothetical protein